LTFLKFLQICEYKIENVSQMRKIDWLLEEYGKSHQNSFNKKVHWVCVPLILLSIIGLIRSIPFPFGNSLGLNWANLVLLLVTLYYLRLSFALALGMFGIALAMLWICQTILIMGLPLLWFSIGVFVLAWLGQFYGHKVEGKKPSFLQDIQFLLIGPAWLLHFVYKKLGLPY
jgi:uncharacterized membrane protein YGL010W